MEIELCKYFVLKMNLLLSAGFETARCLAFHDCTVILACRSVRKAKIAIGKIQSQRRKAKCFAMELDLASLKSVKGFVEEFEKKFK